jgi:antitoxin component of MazEF toxin-antitoxin module
MVKTLTKHGNSYALIIDKPILDLLKINPDTPLEVSTDGVSLLIRPSNAKPSAKAEREARFKEALAWTNKNYEKALRRLAN